MNDLDQLLSDASPLLEQDGLSVLELPPRPGLKGAAHRVDLLLALLQGCGGAVLIVDAHPGLDGEQPGAWEDLGSGQWRVPDVPLDLGELLDWLSEGDWQLVGFEQDAACHAMPAIDLFGEPAASLEVLREASLREGGARWILDVMDDAGPWRLAR